MTALEDELGAPNVTEVYLVQNEVLLIMEETQKLERVLHQKHEQDVNLFGLAHGNPVCKVLPLMARVKSWLPTSSPRNSMPSVILTVMSMSY